MINDLVVLVGQGIGGQEELMRAIQKLDVEVKSAGKCAWPRDDYVYHSSRSPPYLTSHSNGEYKPLGEGGNLQIGDGFILASDLALAQEFGWFQTELESIHESSIEAFEESYPNTRLWVAPTNHQEMPGVGCEHLDLFVLLCPKSKLLLLDTNYGKAANHPAYDMIGEQEGLKIIRYDGSKDSAILPLNGFVLPTQNGADTVLLDERSIGLISLLRDNDVNAVGVPMPYKEDAPGKIGCQLNFYFGSDGVEPQELLRVM